MISSANQPCPCGSGKKYKSCCRAKDEGIRQLFEKLASGQLPFRAEIISSNGEPSSMEVHHAAVTLGDLTAVLLNEKVTLSTNLTSGDKIKDSSAAISIPADGVSPGIAKIVGNASVSNDGLPTKILLAGGVKKLKETSKTGLFVVARIGLQRDTQIEFFDFLFGRRGQDERIDEAGHKQRPHIAFYPDGNGKFIRLVDHNCELEGELQYDASSHQVAPKVLYIKSADFAEIVELMFSSSSSGPTILESICFSSP